MHTNTGKPLPALGPEQKVRLRTAIQILIDYLIEDGRLTQFRHVSQETKKSEQAETGTASTLSEPDSL